MVNRGPRKVKNQNTGRKYSVIDNKKIKIILALYHTTGKTKTNIPKGEKLVEFKIIAVDVDNNKKQVTVVIDPEKIGKDKEILKEARKTAKAKIMVNKGNDSSSVIAKRLPKFEDF